MAAAVGDIGIFVRIFLKQQNIWQRSHRGSHMPSVKDWKEGWLQPWII
jgi:hypothetical protein